MYANRDFYRKCRPTSRRLASTVAMSLPVTDVLGNTVNTLEVVVSLVVCTTTGRSLRFDFMGYWANDVLLGAQYKL